MSKKLSEDIGCSVEDEASDSWCLYYGPLGFIGTVGTIRHWADRAAELEQRNERQAVALKEELDCRVELEDELAALRLLADYRAAALDEERDDFDGPGYAAHPDNIPEEAGPDGR